MFVKLNRINSKNETKECLVLTEDIIGVTEERWNQMSDDFAIVLEQDINEKEEQSEEMEYFEEEDDPDEETIQ